MPDVPEWTWVWPSVAPRSDGVVLRPYRDADVPAVVAMSADPYVPQIDTLRENASAQDALDWIAVQHQRLHERSGFAFAVATNGTDICVGSVGLWLRSIDTGVATVGYSTVPGHRARGVATAALRAVTAFAWTRPPVRRIKLLIEPWNTGSRLVAKRAGYREGELLVAAHEIGGRMRDVIVYEIDRPAGTRCDVRP